MNWNNFIKHFGLIALLAFISFPIYSQDSLVWALQGRTNHLSKVTEVAIMDNGDAVFCGSHDSLITLGSTSFRGPRHRSSSGSTQTSAYVARVSAKKDIRWVIQLVTANQGIYVHDMEADEQGNVWITASCEGNIKFMNGQEDIVSGTGLLLAKVASNGELLWGKTYSGLGSRVHFYHVLPRDDGKCYILGNHGNGVFGESQIPKGGEGQYSQYIGLVDEKGTPIWGRSIGGSGGSISANDFAFDNEGHLLICGNYRYMQVENVINESDNQIKEDVELKTKSTTDKVVSINSFGNRVQAFIGRYHRDTGVPIEVHAYGNNTSSNVTSIVSDKEGNIYVGLNIYKGELTIGGTTIPAGNGTAMAIAKLNKTWEVVWYKTCNTTGSDFADDLCLDGEKLYVATMLNRRRLKIDDVDFSPNGQWSGAVLRFNKNTGWCEWADHWEVGRNVCVAMKDGVGYAGGWFHYETTIGNDRLKVGKNGQFNAVLARIGTAEKGETFAVETNMKVEPEPEPKKGIKEEPISQSIVIREMRKVDAQHSIEVHAREIQIDLWDNRQIDGDVVSVKYNNNWVLENYRLKKDHKVIHLKVESGQPNHVEIYSEDEGSIPPTTTRISIDDGTEVQRISLRSTPETNGMIEIVFAP